MQQTMNKPELSFIIKDLGSIGDATLKLNDLTAIIGPNSSSKTYLTYIIYGFIKYLNNVNLIPSSLKSSKLNVIHDDLVSQLKNGLTFSIDMTIFDANLLVIINEIAANYVKTEAAKNLRLDLSSSFDLSIDIKNIIKATDIPLSLDSGLMFLKKEAGMSAVNGLINLSILDKSLLSPHNPNEIAENLLPIFSILIIRQIISSLLKELFPNVFIITSERTGIAVFIDQLRSLVKERDDLSENDKIKEVDVSAARSKITYQQAVLNNIAEINSINSQLEKSFLSEGDKHNNLSNFIERNINDGSYDIANSNNISFKMKNDLSINLNASSSSVKSLFLIDTYIKYLARQNDLLIIDEPELNLHPSNQRKIARLIAMLVNSGVKVLFTTHSDYLMNEINNLIMLNDITDNERSSILKDYQIDADATISLDKVSVYYIHKDEFGNNVFDTCPIKNGIYEYQAFDDEIIKLSNLSEKLRELL
jgi:predicted ATPase